ncbi:MAG TPA: alpha-amylase family glycosyl hydrolase [Armatimonadaceae bacterium]|nr:alpha-amylase family glycosyl hydrolase [Armatimonadaceae bacterium]
MRKREPIDDVGLLKLDPWLEPYADRLRTRMDFYREALARIDAAGGLLGQISQGHHYFGFSRGERDGKAGVWYREWAPGARSLHLTGDFNDWSRGAAHAMTRDEFGVWHLFLPDEVWGRRLTHGSRVKVHVVGAKGEGLDRLPAYIRRVVQDPVTFDWAGQFWMPPKPYRWRHAPPSLPEGEGLRIYEAHVGMAQEAERVGTFEEFRLTVLPHIADLGYNAVQLMAVMEHPYYASFGYHVGSFFAVASRFGTPEDLKALIDDAHACGIRVLLDLVHSHAIRNVFEGLNRFDGTDYQYFHAGPRGLHPAWDSLLFDYSKFEVQRFLLSNVRFWLEEFRFDGFRFDGITSMMYLDHGLNRTFTRYDDYFPPTTDEDAIAYLKLANELSHALRPDATTIAEDVSGMVGLARPVNEGGLGFDYRLAMGIPDYWIKIIKEQRDEQWDLAAMFKRLLDRRYGEKHIGYAESHDQSLVGDKTMAFLLMDQQMYFKMGVDDKSVIVDRGVALHKLFRLITFSLAGDAYLNFIGNEFGHPEWVDFPREGNDFSYKHARRQWSLVRRQDLRYRFLLAFDKAMLDLDRTYGVLSDPFIEPLEVDEKRRVLVYRRGPLVYAFNFHATESYQGLRIPVPDREDYRVVLDSDAARFGGFARCAEEVRFPWLDAPHAGRGQSLLIYLPSRTAQVLAPASRWVDYDEGE